MATGLKFVAVFVVILLSDSVIGDISDFRLCGDPKCEEPVSIATTLLGYTGNDKHSLAFPKGVDIIVFSKSAGSVPHLWGGMVNGRRGYFPKEFVREKRVLKSGLYYTVPTEKVVDFEKLKENQELNTSSVSRDDAQSEQTIDGIKERKLSSEESKTEVVSDDNTAGALPPTNDLDKSPIHYGVSDKSSDKKYSDGSHDKFRFAESVERSQTENRFSVLKDSMAASPYSYMPSSAFNPSPVLDNVVAHTREVPISNSHEMHLPNSAEWFPELSTSTVLNSDAGAGMAKGASSERATLAINDVKSKDSLHYTVVDGTQILMNDNENSGQSTAVHYGTPTPQSISESIPSLQPSLSVASSANSKMSDLYESNMATDGFVPLASEEPDITSSASPNFVPADLSSKFGKLHSEQAALPVKNAYTKDPLNEVSRSKATEIGSGGGEPLPTQPMDEQKHGSASVMKISENEKENSVVNSEPIDLSESGSGGLLEDIVDLFSFTDDRDETNAAKENSVKQDSGKDATLSNEPVSAKDGIQPVESENVPAKDKLQLETIKSDHEKLSQTETTGDQMEKHNERYEDGDDDDADDDDDDVGDGPEDEDDNETDDDENGDDVDTNRDAASIKLASGDTLNERSYYDDASINDAAKSAQEGIKTLQRSTTDSSAGNNNVTTINENTTSAQLLDSSLNESDTVNNSESSVPNHNIHEENVQKADHSFDADRKLVDIGEKLDYQSGNDIVPVIDSVSNDPMNGIVNPEPIYGTEQKKIDNEIENSNIGTTEALSESNLRMQSTSDDLIFDSTQQANELQAELDKKNLPDASISDNSLSSDFDSSLTTDYSVDSNNGEPYMSSDAPTEPLSVTSPLPTESSEIDQQSSLKSEDTCVGPGFEGSCSEHHTHSGDFTPYLEEGTDAKPILVEEKSMSTLESFKVHLQFIIDLLPDSIKIILYDLQAAAVSPRVVVLVVIVGFFLLLLEITYFVVKRRCRESWLIAKISLVDRELFTCSKERDILKNKLEAFESQNWEEEYLQAQSTIQALEEELKASQNECGKLQADVASLEEQLETATDAGLELNKLLSEFLTSQTDSGKLQEAFTKLQEQLDAQQVKVANLQLTTEATRQEKLALKEELEFLRVNYTTLEQNYNQLNESFHEVQKLRDALEQEGADKNEQIAQMQHSSEVLLKEAEAWNESVKQIQRSAEEGENKMQELIAVIALKDNELEVLKDCVLDLKIANEKHGLNADSDIAAEVHLSESGDILKKLMDASSVKAALKVTTEERDSLLSRLEAEKTSKSLAEEVANRAKLESEKCRAEYEIANREREDAQTKLQVLSNYFKEKELQLQKELGIHEALHQQSQESVVSVTQKIAMYEQETELYKSQISSLKMEIENQERSYKMQLTAHEKKAHENWLAARAAERKLEEAKQEAATLRNRLTLLEQVKKNQATNQTEAPKLNQTYTDSNGEVPSPPRLGPGDRSDSMDLPTSSRSSLLREPLDFPPQGLPFLPPDRPLPPPFMHGLPPRPLMPLPLLPPLDDRIPLPPPHHPFDPRRGSFPMPPPPPPPPLGVMSTPPPTDHWMASGRRVSPPPFDRSSHREQPSPHSHHHLSPPPYERHPASSSRRAASPQDSNPHEIGKFDRDFRERTPPTRFYDPPMGPPLPSYGHPPPPVRGHPGIRPPFRRDVYPPGGVDGSINPRTSSPFNSQHDNDGKASV